MADEALPADELLSQLEPAGEGEAPTGRRHRSTKLDALREKREKRLVQLSKGRKRVVDCEAKLGTAVNKAARQEEVEKARAKLKEEEMRVAALDEQIEIEEQKQEEKEELERVAAAQKEMEADAERAMSDQGSVALVQLYYEMQREMDGSTNKNDTVWQVIYELYEARVGEGKLPASDSRASWQALKRRFEKEHRVYVLLCQYRAKRATTGTPVEEADAAVQHLVR